MNVYVIRHDQYAHLGVPVLPISLFTEVIPGWRDYQDDEDYPMARSRRVVSVAREFPQDFAPTTEHSTWTLSDEAGAAFEAIWAAHPGVFPASSEEG